MFDDRQLKRWGIDRRLLPPGSAVLFHEPSLWERYRGYVIGVVSVVLIQGGLIGALLVQRAQRRRAQQRLAERLRFETLLSDLSTGFVLRGRRGRPADRDRAPAHRRGSRRRSGHHRGARRSLRRGPPHAFVDPEGVPPPVQADPRRASAMDLVPASPGAAVRLPQPGGPPRLRPRSTARLSPASAHGRSPWSRSSRAGRWWAALSVGTLREERHWPDELIVRLRLLADVFANALARQRAERAAQESAEQIRDLAGRLMTAQEEERRRIARELHDDVNQELAALSIALSALEDGLPEGTGGRPASGRGPAAEPHGRAGGGHPAPLARAPSRILQYAGPRRRAPGPLSRVRTRAWPHGDVPGGRRRSAPCRPTSRCASIA